MLRLFTKRPDMIELAYRRRERVLHGGHRLDHGDHLRLLPADPVVGHSTRREMRRLEQREHEYEICHGRMLPLQAHLKSSPSRPHTLRELYALARKQLL